MAHVLPVARLYHDHPDNTGNFRFRRSRTTPQYHARSGYSSSHHSHPSRDTIRVQPVSTQPLHHDRQEADP